MQQAISTAVRHFVDKANEIYNIDLEYPAISFNVRGSTGGTAHAPTNKVAFNLGLMRDNLKHYVEQVVPHEVAHLVSYKLNGDKHEYKHTKRGLIRVSHGRRFYSIMRKFGVEEKRCHDMDVSKVKNTRVVQYHKVKCAGCGDSFEVSTVRKNKMLRGTIYRHKCGNGTSGRISLISF